ncbi:hypothetical protein U9M48_007565 [Paspalum notatum var. saurae]|uniref:Uncharacterized protein n=1 Tax=Paspalum notatum var. saurae TaxID=547442 RepID=A0AAQ3SMI8_PASNO
MGPDFRVLVRKSRKQAQQYYRLYKDLKTSFGVQELPLYLSDETIPVTQLVRETAAVMQEFTQSGYGAFLANNIIFTSFFNEFGWLFLQIVVNGNWKTFQVDPSGSYFSWKASAMGKNVSNAKTFLEKRYTEDMELDDAIHTAILTLKEGVLSPAEIKDFLEEVE